jgi:endonuclease-3
MTAHHRSALIDRAYKVLKKHFKPLPPNPDRPLLEQLLFACCLENARYEAAEEAFARLTTMFFDWNEVRVTTITELAEAMHMLPQPEEAATRVKKTLQSVFEATYSFDLENLKKQNLGQAVARLQKFNGTSPFAVSYVTQATLGGHSIPLDRGALDVLAIVGIAEPNELKTGVVTGLERAIGKNKGVEFASLLHQLGAELVASPFSPAVHKILLEINPDAKERLPKRPTKKSKKEAEQAARAARREAAAAKKAKEPIADKHARSEKVVAGKRPAPKSAPAKAQELAPGKKKTAKPPLSKPKPR